MQISTYENLKSSGSAWLGDIPAHWGTKKLKFLATVQPSNVDKKTVEGQEPVILCNYTDVYKNEYIDGRLEFMQASATEAEIKKFKVDVGDVIVTKDSETPDDIAIPACIAEEVEGLVCGYHLTQIKPIELHGRYLFRLFQSKGFNAQFVVSANGVTRFGLPQHAIANALTPLPPLDEQQAIARFLDFKTAQIDALISKKKKLLDKLAEKRTALISHAVTKGLDPSVPMKDSGVDWLGKIPTHWEAKRTKFSVSYIGSGKTPKGGSEVYVQEGIMILRSQNVHDRGLRLDDVAYITDEADSAQAASRVRAGDVLLNITGASIGRTSIVPTPFPQANVNQHVCILRPIRDLVTSEYLHLLLCSRQAKDQISSLENGTSREGLNFTQVGGLLFAFPPVKEQITIVSNLAITVDAIDRLSEKVMSAIERLVEYRSTVITNAVTGKIDIRGFQMPHITNETSS